MDMAFRNEFKYGNVKMKEQNVLMYFLKNVWVQSRKNIFPSENMMHSLKMLWKFS